MKTVVMIHGAWSRGQTWNRFQSFFRARDYHVISPDLRHHGPQADSEALGRTSIGDFTADVVAIVEQLAAPPVLIGHGLGGLIAQIVSAQTPVRAVVLLSPYPPAQLSLGLLPAWLLVSRVFWRWGFWRQPALPGPGLAQAIWLHALPPSERELVYQHWVPESGRALVEVALGFLGAGVTAVKADAVDCPVLSIGAGRDRFVPSGVAKRIAATYPRGVFRLFRERSHWLIAEPGWTEVAQYAADWLDTVAFEIAS